MDVKAIAAWMQSELQKNGCLYQDDVVDVLVKSGGDSFLRENADGNLVLEQRLLSEFRKLNDSHVVWVKPDMYWRFRVSEDDVGRDARG